MSADDRRDLILDTAERLFAEHGWDAVGISDILKETGLSRGGFYHYFRAKSDLLDAIMTRMTEQAIAVAHAAAQRQASSDLARLNSFFAELAAWKSSRGSEMRFLADLMMRTSSGGLFQRVNTAANAAMCPILAGIISDGMARGSFNCPDATLCAETILSITGHRRKLLQDALAADRPVEPGDLSARLKVEGIFIDRLLGLPEGSITTCTAQDMTLFLPQYPTGQESDPR